MIYTVYIIVKETNEKDNTEEQKKWITLFPSKFNSF